MNPSIALTTQFDPDILNISCSSLHIKKCLLNLIANAYESIEDSGNIIVSTRNCSLDWPLSGYEDVHKGEYAILTVSDNGSGISADEIERIFEPFYSKKVMGRSGTGLGLAVVWNTVKSHEGYIDIKSCEEGTQFELFFPVTRGELPAEKKESHFEDYVGSGEKILVVDDEEMQREIACKLLSRLGYSTDAVSSGAEAIEYLKEHSVHLIVLDMIMPKGMSGRDTYEEIIKISPKQKAIIASGFAETEDVKATQKLGAGKYIKKPYTIENIGVAVKEELEK
jgi:two-component system, cell cycle sensor histidine kinase and response regulator CckA